MTTNDRNALPLHAAALEKEVSADRTMKKWRDASTVIVAARNAVGKTATDFRVLTARRNVESSFMPNSHVFPGGALDPADCSPDWERLHRALGIRQPLAEPSLVSRGRLHVFHTPHTEHLPRYLSLRIAAIREAFEECGFLLCRRAGDPPSSPRQLGNAISPDNTSELQRALRDGGLQFLDVCKRLKCFPDVWSLHEVRNWLTPAQLPKRFDTAFFLVCLEHQPQTVMDEQEVTEIRWSAPKDLLILHRTGTLWLPPPQLYEIGKLSRYRDIDTVKEAALKGEFRCDLCFCPVVVPLNDGFISVLPGDELYEKATHDNIQFMDDTVAALRARCKKMCRLERIEGGADVFVETRDNITFVSDPGPEDPTGKSKL